MRTAIITLLLGLFTFALVGCHTVKGAGQDIQAGGKAIAHAADDSGAEDY